MYMFIEKGNRIEEKQKIRKIALAGLFSVGIGMNSHIAEPIVHSKPEPILHSKKDVHKGKETIFNRLSNVYGFFEGQILSPDFAIKSKFPPKVKVSHNLVSISNYLENQTQITSTSYDNTAEYVIDYRTPLVFGKTNEPKGYIPNRSYISIQVNPGVKNSQFETLKNQGDTSFTAASISKDPNGVWNVQWMGENVIGSTDFPFKYSFSASVNSGVFMPAKERELDEVLTKMEGIILAAKRGDSLITDNSLEYIKTK